MSGPRPLPLLALTVLSLEFASGLPMGLVADFVPVWARTAGLTREAVGALGAIAGLWSLKLLFAPAVDARGTYKAWALGAIGMLALLLGLGAAAGETIGLLLVLVALLGGLNDVALDGWLVTVTPPGQQGRISGLRVASYRTAMALGGGGAIWVGGRYGWHWGWTLAAAALAATGVVIARLPGPPAAERVGSRQFAAELRGWLMSRQTVLMVVFGVLYKLGDAAAATMTRSFWVDAGLSTDDIGLLGAIGGSVLTALGALAGGEMTSRIGLRRGLIWLGGAQLMSNLVYAAVTLAPSRAMVLSAGAFEAVTAGLGTAPLLAVAMRAVGNHQQATRFAAVSATLGLSRAVASLVSGFGVTSAGYGAWFALTAVMAVPGLLMVRTVVDALEAPRPA